MEHQRNSNVALHWIPLGSGQHVVRISGAIYEALAALVQRRSRCDLYHSALTLDTGEEVVVIEVGPIPDGPGHERGVVAEGPVGLRSIGRFRLFRYEVRRWSGGVISDLDAATATVAIDLDADGAQQMLERLSAVPTPVWGRDELGAGEMWNSNSVISWLLVHSGIDVDAIAMPGRGRAPGWDAGIVVARRQRRSNK